MNLIEFLPKNIEWRISENRIFYKKIIWIPFAFLKSSRVIYIYLDSKNSKLVLKTVKQLMYSKVKFYLVSPLFDDPHIQRDSKSCIEINIENYLKNFAKEEYFDGFEKIRFDYIENLISYCKSTKSFELIKGVLEKVNKEVQFSWYDYYSKKQLYQVKREDIRQRFNNLYRDIQIQNLLK